MSSGTLSLPPKFFGPKFMPGERVRMRDNAFSPSWATVVSVYFVEEVSQFYYMLQIEDELPNLRGYSEGDISI